VVLRTERNMHQTAMEAEWVDLANAWNNQDTLEFDRHMSATEFRTAMSFFREAARTHLPAVAILERFMLQARTHMVSDATTGSSSPFVGRGVPLRPSSNANDAFEWELRELERGTLLLKEAWLSREIECHVESERAKQEPLSSSSSSFPSISQHGLQEAWIDWLSKTPHRWQQDGVLRGTLNQLTTHYRRIRWEWNGRRVSRHCTIRNWFACRAYSNARPLPTGMHGCGILYSFMLSFVGCTHSRSNIHQLRCLACFQFIFFLMGGMGEKT
jgi:hypothetical protein